MPNLIAREKQTEILNSVFQETLTRRFNIIFLTGEAGAGKTSLLNAFSEKIKTEMPEVMVAGGNCHAITGSQEEPYIPFITILSQLYKGQKSEKARNRFVNIVGEISPDWIALIPIVGGTIAAVTRTAQVMKRELTKQNDLDGLARMVQYTNTIKQISDLAPLLLWIEDIHWSDTATLDLISFMADHAPIMRCCLIVTYRPTDIEFEIDNQAHPVKKLVGKLNRYGQCTTLAVPNFSFEDLNEYIISSNHIFPNTFLEHLWQNSGGNPLFVREYLSYLHFTKALGRAHGKFILRDSETEIKVPQTVQKVIDHRLELLPEKLLRILMYASVQGEKFETGILSMQLETTEDLLLERLNQLDRKHRLIKELGKNKISDKLGYQFEFIHSIVQQVLYSMLGEGQRTNLHKSIGQTLENIFISDTSKYAVLLAKHFEYGGQQNTAISYYLKASRNSLSLLAFDNAIAQVKSAERLMKNFENSTEWNNWHIESLLTKIQAHYWKADYSFALRLCQEGEEFCRKYLIWECQSRFLYWHSRILHVQGKYLDELDVIKNGLQLLGDPPINELLQGYYYKALGTLHNYQVRSEIIHALDKSVAISEKNQDPELKVLTLLEQAWGVLEKDDNPEGALELLKAVIVIARDHMMLSELSNAYKAIGQVYRRLKNGEEAFSSNMEAEKIARRSGMPVPLHRSLCRLALSWWEVKEDSEQALSTIREAVNIAEQYQFPIDRDVITSWFFISFSLGKWKDVERIQHRYEESAGAGNPRGWAYFYAQEGHHNLARGRFVRAVEAYEEAANILAQYSQDDRELRRVKPFLGLAQIGINELSLARAELQSSLNYWERRDSFRKARCLRGLAKIEFIEKGVSNAIPLLEEGLRLSEGSYGHDAWPDWQHIQVDLGRYKYLSKDLDKAFDLVSSSYEQLKRWKHFLLGEAAFLLGQVYIAKGQIEHGIHHLNEAKREWKRLGFDNDLKALDNYIEDDSRLTDRMKNKETT